MNICEAVSKKWELIKLLDYCKKQKSKIDIIPNYTLISTSNKHKKGGGIAISINDKIKHHIKKDLTISENKNFESVFIEMTCKKNIVIGSLYRPTNTSETEFLNSYDYLLKELKLGFKKK